jgi:ammonia channel protein AmtB
VIAVGLFSSASGRTTAAGGESGAYGLRVGGGAEQLGAQLIGAGVILAWTAGLSAVLFGAFKYTIGLRVSEEEEIEGLDRGEHGMSSAYPEFVTDLEPTPAPGGALLGGAPAGGK